MKPLIPKNDWSSFFEEQMQQEYWEPLMRFLEEEIAEGKVVFPRPGQIFRAFEACSLEKLQVIILGQDPYHGDGQANGLAFSVPQGQALPPSLKNIFKEVEANGFGGKAKNGDLQHWAEQGVLLLNTCLTVERGKPASHQGKGWEEFTEAVMRHINTTKQHVVYMLWGSHAQSFIVLIDTTKNKVLTAPHPSPLSAYRGFLGCKHFEYCNAYFDAQSLPIIDWH